MAPGSARRQGKAMGGGSDASAWMDSMTDVTKPEEGARSTDSAKWAVTRRSMASSVGLDRGGMGDRWLRGTP